MSKIVLAGLSFIFFVFSSVPAFAQIPTSGLRLHLKADAETSTTISGQKVATWNDQSGNGFQAYQDNSSQQPTYIVDSGVSMDLATPTDMEFNTSDSETLIEVKTSSSTSNITISNALEGEVQFSSVGSSEMTLTFPSGGGLTQLVFVKSGSAVTLVPQNGYVYPVYPGNEAFGNGNDYGGGNGTFAVYNGTGNSVTVTNLSPSTVYHFAVFQYYNSFPYTYPFSSFIASNATSPSTAASNVQFSSIGVSEMTVSFTPGNGNKRIVLAREGAAVSAVPTNGQSYTASTTFGSGSDLGSGNYVVYNGTGSSVTLSSLTNSTTYHYSVYEFSEYSGGTTYLTTSPAVSSTSTTIVPYPTISAEKFGKGTSTSRKIAGLINPNGYETTVDVIYGTDAGNLSSSTSSHSIGSGVVNVADTVSVTGLITGQTYYAKIRATNLRGTVESSVVTLVPLNTTSLTAWYRGDIAQVNQFNSVTNWIDYSDSGHDLVNPTNNPTQALSSINSKPGVNFSDDRFRFLPSYLEIQNTDLEMFIVFKSSSNTTQGIFYQDTYEIPLQLNKDNVGLLINPSSGYPTEVGSGALNAYTNGNGHIMHYKSANNRYQVRVNNGSLNYKNGNNRFTSNKEISLGGKLFDKSFNGQIAEILFFNAALPFEQRQEIAQYLSDRYAISMYIPSVPETAASDIAFSNIEATQFDVSFTAGSGAERLIVARLTSSPKTAPVNNTVYTANANFGSGSNLGNGNYVIGKGTGTSVSLTNLGVATDYTIDVYEYNFMELDPQYMSSSPNSASQTTQSVTPPVVQLDALSGMTTTSVTIESLINPNGFSTNMQISYGTTSGALNTSTSAQAVGSQSSLQSMNTVLTGLTAGTKYFYKISATNIGGTTESAENVFYTGYEVNHTDVSLPSLAYWLAGDGATYTSGTGQPVRRWANQAGNSYGLNAYQNVEVYLPQFVTESGISFVRFDGANDYLELAPSDSLGITNSNYEVFIVAKSSSTNIGFLMGGSVENFEIHTRPEAAAGTRFIPKSGILLDNTVNSTDGNFHIFNAKATSSKALLRLDGNSSYINQDARSAISSGLILGTRRNGSYYFDGDIAEVIIYNSDLTESESQKISNYLATKYSVTLTPFTVPTVQASALVFSNYVDGGVTASVTAGNGTQRLVVIRPSGTAAVAPTNGLLYTANATYGSGATTGTGNYVVSASTATSVDITGLSTNSEYVVDVYEFNQAGSDPKYVTSSPASGTMQALDFSIYEGKIAYVVTSNSDTNTGTGKNGTLRYVINAINTHASDSTSLIDMRLITGTVTLTSELPAINYNTILVGSGSENLTISGNNLYRPFFIGAGTTPFTAENPASPTITLKDFSIINGLGKGGNGYAGSGGAAGMGGALFVNAGNVTLENLDFASNIAQGGSGDSDVYGSAGGGGFAGNGGTSVAGASGYLGGSVPNTAGASGGPGAGGFGDAYVVGNGGFGAGGASASTIFTGGIYSKGGDGGFGGGGGAYGSFQAGTNSGLVNGVGGFGAGNGITYSGTDMRGGGGAGMGGAVFNRTGDVIIKNSTFTSNSAEYGLGGGDGYRSNGSSYGGAIFNYDGTILTTGVTFGSGGGANSAINTTDYYNYNASGSVVTLSSPTNSLATSFTANAEIITFGRSGSYHVAYGTDNSSFPETTNSVNFNGQSSALIVGIPVSGINLNNDFYYKIVVTNEFGTYESTVGSLILEPTSASSLPVITSLSASTINGTLTIGNGTKRLILVKKGSAVDAQPVDGQSYSSSSNFGSGAEIGSGNFVVFNATESTFAITGLEAGNEYHFKVFEYNGTSLTDYQTSSTLSFSEHTISSIPQLVSGSSLKFNGDDEHVLVPLHSSLQPTSSISLEAWIKPSLNTAYAQIVGNIWDDALTESGYGLMLNGGTGLFFAVKTSGNAGSNMEYLSGDGITLNEWNHVAASFDGTTKRIYINGKEVASSAANTGTINHNPANNVRLGRFVDGDETYAFKGEMDEVRIWNTVRTHKEIRENMFASIQSDFQDLISYWQFNEGSESTASDIISGNNGTLTNFEFDSTNGWFDSQIPFGTGTYSEFENISSGTHNGSNVSVTLTDNFDNAVTLITNYFTVAPNVLVTGATTKIEDAYWVISAAGNPGTFSASLSFTVPTSLTTGGVSANSQFKLYRRNLGSSGAWELVSSSAASNSSNTVVFDGITQFGQFTVSRTFDIEFDQFAGKSILFDGSNDYVSVSHNAVFNVSKYTMEFWFKWNKAGNDIEFLTGKYYSEFEIHTNGANNSIRFIPAPQVYIDSPTNAFELNTWTHLTVVYDPSQSLAKMYFNGIEVAITNNGSSGLSTPIVNSTNPISFGTRTGGVYYYTGELDEIRIWNTVRTPAEILEDMSNTSPSEYNSDLVAYWQFNEGTGNSTEESANGLTGTLELFNHNESSGWRNSLIPITQTTSFEITLTGTQGWRLLASPITADSYSPLLSSIWTQGFTGANTTSGSSNIYTWPISSSGNSNNLWTPLANMETQMQTGSGILAYVYSDDDGQEVGVDAGFPKTISISGTEVIENKNLSAQLNANTSGWTLLGNPFSTDIDWDLISKANISNAVYVWDNSANSWKTWNGSVGSLADGKIGAFNGFFIETTNANPTFTIPTNARVDGNDGFIGKKTSDKLAQISVSIHHENGLSNEAWFMFSEKGALGKDATDSYKLAPLSSEFVQISSVIPSSNQENIELDINSLPDEFTQVNIPLRISASELGEIQLSFDSSSLPMDWKARLWDSEFDEYYSIDEQILINLETIIAKSTSSNSSETSASTSAEKVDVEHVENLSNLKSLARKKAEAVSSTKSSSGEKSNPEIQSSTFENTRFVLQIAKGKLVDMGEVETPKTIELSQNYPNPFNPSTTIKFGLPEAGPVRLDLFDVTGKLVQTIFNENKQAGFHQINFDASRLSSGLYFYRFSTNKGHITKKMLLVK